MKRTIALATIAMFILGGCATPQEVKKETVTPTASSSGDAPHDTTTPPAE